MYTIDVNDVQSSYKFKQVISVPQNFVDLHKQINDEADTFNPIDENRGTRISDIDTVQSSTNPVFLAQAQARMSRDFTDLDTSQMSDEDIASLVVPAGTTVNDVKQMLDYHKSIINTPKEESVPPTPAPVDSPKTE